MQKWPGGLVEELARRSLPFQWDHYQGGRSWSWARGPRWEHIQPLLPVHCHGALGPESREDLGPLLPLPQAHPDTSLRCLQTHPNTLHMGPQ